MIIKVPKKRASNQVRHPSTAPSILVILALPEERGYFHRLLTESSNWYVPSARDRFKATFQSSHGSIDVVVHTLEGMGNIEASVGVGSAIVATNPNLALMVGLAGSLMPQDVQLGDVVVSNQAKLYSGDKVRWIDRSPDAKPKYQFNDEAPGGNGEITVDRRDAFMSGSFTRYERKVVSSKFTDDYIGDAERPIRDMLKGLGRMDAELVPAAHRAAYGQRTHPHLHSGYILASSHVVDSAEYRDYLVEKNTSFALDVHRQTNHHDRLKWEPGALLAVDMESYGFLRAVELARSTPPQFGGAPTLLGGIVIRGISDLCEQKAETDKDSSEQTRRIAVENASRAAMTLIETLSYDRLMAP